MSLLISPNVKKIYNDHFQNMWAYIPDCTLEYYPIKGREIIVIQIQTLEYINSLQDEFNYWFDKFKEDGLIEDVSITGIKENMNDGQGSSRYSTNSKNLSEYLTKILQSFDLEIYESEVENYKNFSPVYTYKFNKVSNYFRFMKYKCGGQHYPHYDSNFQFNNTIAKWSLVMYFNDCEDGELVFCKDSRIDHYNEDWDRQCTEEEILLKLKPKAGMIVLFPHTFCHAVLPFTGEERNIVRGDLEFIKV